MSKVTKCLNISYNVIVSMDFLETNDHVSVKSPYHTHNTKEKYFPNDNMLTYSRNTKEIFA